MGRSLHTQGRPPAPVTAAFAAAAAWLVVYELHVVLAPGAGVGPLGFAFSRYAHDVVLLGASALCLGGALRQRGPARVAWVLVALGTLAWSLGEVYYTAVLWEAADPPIPSPADIGYLLFPPLTLAGAVVLLRARLRGFPRRRWLDGLTAALCVSAVSAGLVFETVHGHVAGKPLAVAAGMAYPLWDLVLLGVFVGALAGTGWRLDRTWILLALGVSTFWLADSLYLVRTADGVYESGGWFDAGWWAGLLLIAAAAWQPPPAVAKRAVDETVRAAAVPVGFGLVGLAVLVCAALRGLNVLAIGLAAGSLLCMMSRTLVVLGDNVRLLRASRREALTDALTGLDNRRALTRALEARLGHASPERPLVLALFDLDGFKHYNDVFGHPAGDALLVRLAAALEAFMADRGQVFRMGGDEFCALFEPGPEGPDAVLAGAARALSEEGEGFAVSCSHGAIMLPSEADAPSDALRLADQRMYANKHDRRVSAGRRAADALLLALAGPDRVAARDAEVVELAVTVAQALGLSPEEVVAVVDPARR